MKKKILTSIILFVMIVAVLPVAAFAHGGRGSSQKCSYPLCPVGECNTTGIHRHDGICYSGHRLGDGHGHHRACPVQECTKRGTHTHDGVEYFPRNDGEGDAHHNNRHGGRRRH